MKTRVMYMAMMVTTTNIPLSRDINMMMIYCWNVCSALDSSVTEILSDSGENWLWWLTLVEWTHFIRECWVRGECGVLASENICVPAEKIFQYNKQETPARGVSAVLGDMSEIEQNLHLNRLAKMQSLISCTSCCWNCKFRTCPDAGDFYFFLF